MDCLGKKARKRKLTLMSFYAAKPMNKSFKYFIRHIILFFTFLLTLIHRAKGRMANSHCIYRSSFTKYGLFQLTDQNIKIKDGVIVSTYKKDLLHCVGECVMIERCLSINFNPTFSHNNCESLDNSKENISAVLEASSGWEHYEPITTISKNSIESIDGGGWKLVRHVPPGNNWYQATDQLNGSDVYGIPSGPHGSNGWSIRFDNVSFFQFLFATGDSTMWLIASKDEVIGSFYSNELRLVTKSSVNPNKSYTVRWYRRKGALEDPWISLTDHHHAISQGNLLYSGNSWGGAYASSVLPIHDGANVFIR